MANKALQSIQFPGLENKYTVAQVDDTLAVTGAAADAKKTGDEITDLKADLIYNNQIVGIHESFVLSGALINSSGVIESVNNYDLYCVTVTPGEVIAIDASPSENFAFSFFAAEPTIGSTSYNNSRVVVWESTKTNILVPANVAWLAVRVGVGNEAVVTQPPFGLCGELAKTFKKGADTGAGFDADNAEINTFVYVGSSYTGSSYHLPAGSGVGYLFTIANNANVKSQIYMDVANNIFYIRRYITSWSAWSNIYDLALVKALKKGADTTTGFDANNAEINTFVYVGSSYTGSSYHLPDGSGVGYLFTIANNASVKSQIYMDITTNVFYVRRHITSWGAWSNLYDKTLTNSGTVTGTFDFNDATVNAWSYILSSDCANAPVTGTVNGTLLTFSITATVKSQVFIEKLTGITYTRLYSSNVWSSWASNTGSGEYVYEKEVSTASELYTELVNMPNASHIIVAPGTYDISQYIEANDEITIKPNCWIEGRGKAEIICNLSAPSETKSIFLMGRRHIKITGLTLTGSNLRYLIHDEMGGGNDVFAYHEYIDCDFNYTSPKFETIYDICRSFGCGLGNNANILIENCTFNDTNASCINIHSNSVVYHPEQTQPFAPARVVIKDCYSGTSGVVYYTVTGDTGNIKNPMYISNNAFYGGISTTGSIAFAVKEWNNVDLSQS